MKVRSAICLFLVLALLLCSCGRQRGEEPQSTQPTTSNTVRVTFPEGKTTLQIAQLLEENGVCGGEDFLQAMRESEREWIAAFAQEDRPFLLEGYVFPDTYEFYLGESARSALGRFLSNFEAHFSAGDETRCAELGMTRDEIVTLASIIQAEAGIESEMAKVSAVLHNRLEQGMKLQCDATYFYLERTVMPYLCGEDWDDAVYEQYADLYYTYRISGLPLGAICNPGAAALHAALYPADSQALYFVTDSENNYYYSDTYEQHRATCERIGL